MLLVITVLATTTCAACLLVQRFRGSSRESLRYTLDVFLECIGASVVFLVVNLGLGVGLVLVIRGLTPWFVSLYEVSDTLFVFFAILQGFIFQLWWRSAGSISVRSPSFSKE